MSVENEGLKIGMEGGDDEITLDDFIDIEVRSKQDRYPFCLVWTPIPGITWFLPMVGHMGICDSKGVSHDFAGPYTINKGDLAFGKTSRYLQLVKKDQATRAMAKRWDEAIQAADADYCTRMHNLFWDNCHSHCKQVLNRIQYGNFRYWNMGILAMWMFFQGRFVRFWYSILPSLLIYGVIFLIFVL